MKIIYKVNQSISTGEFKQILKSSSLSERRPVDDNECLSGMIQNSNLMITAWDGEKLIGIARSVTDFHYTCYLSDLAVDKKYQNSGIGKELQKLTQNQLGPKCKLILIAAPKADSYYEHIGFTRNPRCWILEPDQNITSHLKNRIEQNF